MIRFFHRVSACALALFAVPAIAQVQLSGNEVLRVIQNGSTKTLPLNAAVTAALPEALSRSGLNGGVEGATPTNLMAWTTARSKMRAGAADTARVMFVGDSKTMGAGAGSGGRGTNGAFARSRPARVAALLAAGGLNARLGFLGYNGATSAADRTAFDPRVTFGAGWTGSANSIGGAMMTAGPGSGGLTVQPVGPVDRFSLLYRNGADRPAFTITKGSETITVTPSGPTLTFGRYEAVFSTRDAAPIVVTQTGSTNNITIIGGAAWDSTTPSVEVMNGGVYGVTSGWWTDAASGIAPLSALGSYAPHLTIINLGTNDLNQNVPMATWLSNLRVIIGVAKQSGSVVLTWPAIAVENSYGSDTTRKTWATAARALATELGCVFVNEEDNLGGRAAAQAAGALADGVHEAGWAYDAEAAVLVRAIQ